MTATLHAAPPGAPRARMMLQRARWAAAAFAGFDRERTRRVVEAVAEVAYQNSQRFAEMAVAESGMGVVAHKRRKNEACSRGLLERYGGEDFAGLRVDAGAKIVSVPKPAGVVLALTPSTNPVATVYFKVLLALMTRNAVVVSPHPQDWHLETSPADRERLRAFWATLAPSLQRRQLGRASPLRRARQDRQ